MKSNPHWRSIAFGAGAAMFLGMALGRFSYSAMIPALVETGHLDSITAGYVGGANMAGFLVGAALSTIAAQALRVDRVLYLSIVLAVIALVASAVPWGPLWLGVWRALAGVATGSIMVLGLAVTAQAAPPEHRTRAMSYIFVGVGSGILFGATVVPAALGYSIFAAWTAVAIAGLIAGVAAILAWWQLSSQSAAPNAAAGNSAPSNRAQWYAVIAASFLFSFALVPHTIYWFDYLARDQALGYTVAGWHWTGVGIFAIVGPIVVSRLAGWVGTALTTAITYIVLGIGICLPWLSQVAGVLIASTVIFGAQPAASTMLGARARDLGEPDQMPTMMRTIILSNGIGSALGGVAIPRLLDVTGSYELLFLTGGAAMLLGGLFCAPAIRRA